ncbi:MAG: hypothetical protein JW959_14495, partial [Pirellulales bacterium]|nr:hypothetical protein [Pirellulales bacterium]
MNSRRLLRLFVLLVLSSAALGAIARAEEKPPWSITPAPRKAARWQKRHAEKNELAKKGNVDLLFIGDSITHGWEYGGKKVWKKYYAQRNALNLGFGGDGFEQVLWRLDNGNIDGIHPKLAVVMIGTNNSRSPAGKIAKGIELILDKLKEKLPKTKVLLLAIFPRADHPDMQENLVEVNKLISKFDDGKRVFYLDIGEKFLNSDGRLGREIMPDLLHLNAKGYEIWAEAIEPSVKKLMGEEEPQTRNVRQRPFIVARADRPACVLVCSTNSELRRRAARAVADGARDICGVSLPLNTAKLPPSVSWILVETVEKDGLDDAAIAEAIAVAGREKAPPAGFALRRLERAVAMLADEESAAYQGSVHLRDVLLNRQGNDAVIEDFPALASPFAVRGLYHLTCWGRSPEYRLKDWKVVFDSMAEDGINADYFWMSGLFRSQKCPQAFTYPAHAPSTKEIRRLIDYAHSLGIEFYLGSGVFAWFGIDALAEAHPETKAVGSTGGMCPSNPLARKLNLDYLTEMHDAFPAADGLFLEIRDEYGDCKCPRCAESVPQGGTRYAQSELSFFAELKDAVWKNHPRTKFLWCIGYSDNVHAADKAYYEQLTGEFNDPRFQWLEVRNNWRLPAADGRMRPLRWFSPNMISWSKPYCLSPDAVRSWLKKSEDERMLGAAAAFEPGFHSASYY